MRRRHGINLASLVVGVLAAIALPDPTAARIQCQGNFQITKYGPIATPYCEDEQIAIVAQSYGLHISASEIHNNPLKKIIGHGAIDGGIGIPTSIRKTDMNSRS